MQLGRAASATFFKNSPALLPIIMLWAMLWFVLVLLECLFSRRNDNEADYFTVKNAAKTLAGIDGKPSLSGAIFQILQKGLRMQAFLSIPAVAWEGLSAFAAIRKGIQVTKGNLSGFAAAFTTSSIFEALLFLPAALVIFLSQKFQVQISDPVWFVTFLYIAVAWSYAVYIEMIFCAEIYLWHLKWERIGQLARSMGLPAPVLADVQPPRMLDCIPDLVINPFPELKRGVNGPPSHRETPRETSNQKAELT